MPKKYGIDGFIVSWNEKKKDKQLNTILDSCLQNSITAAILLEPSAISPTGNQEKYIIQQLTHILETIALHPAYLNIDDKPVIFISAELNNNLRFWLDFIIKVNAKKTPRNGAIFITLLPQSCSLQQLENLALIFDGLCTLPLPQQLESRSESEVRHWAHSNITATIQQQNKVSCIACVYLQPGTGRERNIKFYENAWTEVIEMSRAKNPIYPHWVIIDSWNGWQRSTEIDSSIEFLGDYLAKTAIFSEQFKSDSTDYYYRVPETHKKLVQIFE